MGRADFLAITYFTGVLRPSSWAGVLGSSSGLRCKLNTPWSPTGRRVVLGSVRAAAGCSLEDVARAAVGRRGPHQQAGAAGLRAGSRLEKLTPGLPLVRPFILHWWPRSRTRSGLLALARFWRETLEDHFIDALQLPFSSQSFQGIRFLDFIS